MRATVSLAALLLLASTIPVRVPAQSQSTGAGGSGAAARCSRPEFRQFDFWVGEWEVTRPDGRVVGTNRIERVHGNCGIREQWTSAQGSAGTSLNIYDASSGRWHQTWIDDQGNLLQLDGGLVDGVMRLEGATPRPQGGTTLHRVQWQPLPGTRERVRQLWESSTDGGTTWTVVFDGTYRPRADAAPAAPTTSPGAAVGAWRRDFLRDVEYFEQRFVDLARRMPADKYAWRPAEGVRSVSEVFLHVPLANYMGPTALGVEPPAGFQARGFEKRTTDKDAIVDELRRSFAHLRQATLSLSDADADKAVRVFGADHTYRSALTLFARHLGEHLGQSIAYARVNGIVPPWTEEAQRLRQQSQQPRQGQRP